MNTTDLTWNDPEDGTAFAVAAGGAFAMTFRVVNQSQYSRQYRYDLVGLPSGWVDAATTDQLVGPKNERLFKILISPPSSVTSRQVSFKLQRYVGDEFDEDFQERSYTIAVSSFEAESATTTVPVSPEAVKPVVPEAQSAPSAESAPLPQAIKKDPPKLPDPTPQQITQPTQPQVEEPVFYEPPAIEPPIQPETDAVDPFPDFDVVLFVAEGSKVPTIRLSPGQKALLRFGFTSTRLGTYAIEEDYSLPQGWIHLIASHENIPRGATGERRATISIPLGTKPKTFQLEIRVGPEDDALTPYEIVLVVEPSLAVTIGAEQPCTVVGPGVRDAAFSLSVNNAGNADTGYRIQVTEVDETGRPEPVFETTDWRYLVDKEVENLKSPTSNAKPVPQSHTLIVRRKGTWWNFGWVESHQLKVYAAPVTAQTDTITDQNSVDLTVKRWRILPMPWYLCAGVLALLLPIVGGKPSNLQITNGFPADEEINNGKAISYVLDTGAHLDTKADIEVRATYEAPFFSWLKRDRSEEPVSGPKGEIRDMVEVPADKYDSPDYTYRVRSFLGFGEEQVVRLAPSRSNRQLQLLTEDGQVRKFTVGQKTKAGNQYQYREYTIHISAQNGYKGIVYFKNLATNLSERRQIKLWTLHWPAGFDASQRDVDFNPVIPAGVELKDPAKLICTDTQAAAEDKEGWSLVTTDAACPLLVIRFQFGNGKDSVEGGRTGVTPIAQRKPVEGGIRQDRPQNISKMSPDREPKKSILAAIRTATAKRLNLQDPHYDVSKSGSLLLLNGFAVLRAPVVDAAGKAVGYACGIAHQAGGNWTFVDESADAAALKQNHSEVPSALFGD